MLDDSLGGIFPNVACGGSQAVRFARVAAQPNFIFRLDNRFVSAVMVKVRTPLKKRRVARRYSKTLRFLTCVLYAFAICLAWDGDSALRGGNPNISAR